MRIPVRRTLALGTIAALAVAGVAAAAPASAAAGPLDDAARLVDHVNPFIGTQNEGNTYPGATVPFGMVQLSPDTGHNTGYDYAQNHIQGFSLVHLSGVGCGLGGFLPVLPTTGAVTTTDDAAYALPFSHDTEQAHPGSYAVDLTAPAGTIHAELGATEHTGVQRYTYPATTQANVMIDAGQALSSVTHSTVRIDPAAHAVETDITVRGFCQDTEPFTVHTRTVFDRAFTGYGTWTGTTTTSNSTSADSDQRSGAYVTFDTTSDATVEAQTSLSYVDAAGAEANLTAEATSLDDAVAAASDTWEQRLKQVQVTQTAQDADQLSVFYSALYRSFLAPNTGTDIDGRYRGWDDAVHTADGFTYYQDYSLWDTYRSQQQLLALLAPQEAADQAYSLVLQAQQGGWAPRWGYGPVETNIMTGDPITPTLVSAWSEGLLTGDRAEAAYEVLKQNADGVPPADSPSNGRAGNETYIADGFVPYDAAATGKPGDYDLQHGGSATLEYALADATLSTMAAGLGHADDAHRYAVRAQNYKAIWDTTTKSFRARTADGAFVSETDPASAPGFHEGTAVQYEWLVQQDMPGLIALMGGTDAAAQRLDDFFAYDQLLDDPAGTASDVWVSGAYSYYSQDKYNPNNEPDLHSPWAYLWVGQPWKTSDVLRAALTLFTTGPTGVTGNDDLGEMSSWAVLSMIGIYPIVPGTDTWGLAAPVFDSVHITLDPAYYPSGSLDIQAPGTSDDVHYIQTATVGGTATQKAYLTGDQLTSAGTIAYTVGGTPSSWATGADAAPGAIVPATDVPDRLTLAASPATVTVRAGTRGEVDADVVAQSESPVEGTVTATSDQAGVTVTAAGGFSGVSNGLPLALSVPLAVRVDPGTPVGAYPVHLHAVAGSVSDDAGVTVVVPGDSWLQPALTSHGLADRGDATGDFDGGGYYFIRDTFDAAGVHPGVPTQVPGSDLTFTISAQDDNTLAATGQTVQAAGLGDATQLSLVGAGTNGTQSTTLTLRYTDGSTSTATVTLADWCSGTLATGSTLVVRPGERGHGTAAEAAGCGIAASAPIALSAGKHLDAITFGSNARFHVLAIASDVEAQAPSADAPVISGLARTGHSLAVAAPTWDLAGVATSYQWSRDGVDLAGETSRVHTVTPADVGHELAVTVIGAKAGYATARLASEPVEATAGIISADRAPSIQGTAQVDKALSLDPGVYTPASATVAVQWMLDGQPIDGATGTRYTPPATAYGSQVTARVTVSQEGYQTLVLDVDAAGTVAGGTLAIVTAPVISLPEGSEAPTVGDTLSVDDGTYSVADVTVARQWYLDGEAIEGATTSSLPVTDDMVGRVISVVTTATRTGYTPVSATSLAPGAVAPARVAASADVAVTGTHRVGSTLTAVLPTYTPAADVAYQWLRDGTPIAGATGATRVLNSYDLGAVVTVRVTASAAGRTPLVQVSAETSPVLRGQIAVVTAPRITGTASVGSTLTVARGTYSVASLTYTISWLRDGKTVVGHATTYTPTAADRGHTLQAKVVVTKAGYSQVVSLTSKTAAVR